MKGLVTERNAPDPKLSPKRTKAFEGKIKSSVNKTWLNSFIIASGSET